MRVLLSTTSGAEVPGTLVALPDLAIRYAAPATEHTWLRANMVSTLDGAATGADGRSGSITTAADKTVFDLLRAISDAVVVGAGTVRTEGYSPLRLSDEYAALRADVGLPAALPLVVITRSGRLPTQLLQQGDDAPVHVIVPGDCAQVLRLRSALGAAAVHVAGDHDVDLPAGVRALHDIGWRRLLSEGGPGLLGDLLRAELVDELDLTIAPILHGGPQRRIVGGEPLTPPMDFHPALLLEWDGSVIGRWVRR